MRLTFLQFGDFRESARRFEECAEETFQAQRYSMEVVERLASSEEEVSVVCVASKETYRERLDSGVLVYGMQLYPASGRPDYKALLALLNDIDPSHVVLRFPDAAVIRWCFRHNRKVFPCFADSFPPERGLRSVVRALRGRRIGPVLRDARVQWIGNHNIAASLDVARLGVSPDKIIPWDWPRQPTPDDFSPKQLNSAERPYSLAFVGTVSEAKGLGDIIRAFGENAQLARTARLTVVGGGQIDAMKALAEELGVSQCVDFLGLVPFRDVISILRDHDASIVYTRHEYAEGLPGVIYESLTARTPLILSDHPMFTAYLSATEVSIVPERSPRRLADEILKLLGDPERYDTFSAASKDAFRRIALTTYWADVVEKWLSEAPADHAWLSQRSLKALNGAPVRQRG